MTNDGWTVTTDSVNSTRVLGERLGRVLKGGLTVALAGPLGAGKTHLVKGIALGNGLDDDREVTSPTFTLVQEYHGRLTLYHVDAYRLRNDADLLALGFFEMVRADAVVLVEWADRVWGAIPFERLTIALTVTGDHSRSFCLTATGPMAQEVLAALRGLFC